MSSDRPDPPAATHDKAALDIGAIQAGQRAFVAAREWQKFHTPKNLAMALAGEAGELVELFQWLTAEESRAIMDEPRAAEAVRDELADVLLYVLRLADVLQIDVGAAVRAKMRKNEAKYPADRVRGVARKYTEIE